MIAIRALTPLHIPVVRSSVKDLPRPVRSEDRAGAEPDWSEDDPGGDDDVLRIGPTEHLNGTPRQFGNEPPDGERERLIWAMEQCAWVQAKAARLLKVTPRQLGYALRKYSIEVHKF